MVKLQHLVLLAVVGGCDLSGGSGGDGGGSGDDGGGSDDPECSSARDCDSLQFCYDDACEGVLGRKFEVVVVSATSATNADWDGGGGAPDPFVVIEADGDGGCATSTKDDDFEPRWNESCRVVLSEGGKLEISMYDEDVTSNDTMLTYKASGSDELVDLVVTGEVSLENDYASLELRFEPDF